MLSQLVLKHLILAEPQSDFFLRTLDSVGAVADVPANVLYFNQPIFMPLAVLEGLRTHNGVVPTNGTWG